ncbi:MAG: hypothetical protein U5L96_05440 [Owenweeksia sp.]|nr:hypothetical protein [Owenweeksia sp.]
MNTKVNAIALLILFAALGISTETWAQFTVPTSGGDTSNVCAGILRDPAGTGNYLNNTQRFFRNRPSWK